MRCEILNTNSSYLENGLKTRNEGAISRSALFAAWSVSNEEWEKNKNSPVHHVRHGAEGHETPSQKHHSILAREAGVWFRSIGVGSGIKFTSLE
jgi:hypothetical protein